MRYLADKVDKGKAEREKVDKETVEKEHIYRLWLLVESSCL